MHVTLVARFEPDKPSAGGTRSYVESLAGFLLEAGVPHTVVVASDTQASHRGHVAVRVRRGGSSLHYLAALLTSATSLDLPPDTIVHAQRPDDLVPFLLSGLGRAYVCTMHGNPLEAIQERKGRIAAFAFARVESCVLGRVNQALFVDEKSAAGYLRRIPSLASRMAVVPNGVDFELFRPMEKKVARAQWRLDPPVVLYAGRLEREKQVVDVVRAFRDAHQGIGTLVVAGEGRDLVAAQTVAEGAPVRFVGPVARSEMPTLINAADAVILYSTREGLPSIVLESLACSVPVIVTPVGDIPNVVRHGENGFMVESRQELVDAIQTVIQGANLNPGRIRDSVRDYSWDRVGARILSIYNSL